MKRIFSLLLISFLIVTYATAQSNNLGSGTNYYDAADLIGKTLPSLSTAPTGYALVFVDYSHSNDGVVTALKDKDFVVTVASSWSDFSTKLSNGTYHLAVGFAQDYPAVNYGLDINAIRNFIDDGGSMIFASWTTYDASVLALFDASFSGNINLSTVTITDAVVASGLTNPFTLTNPSWGTYSRGLNALTGGEVLATFENGDAAMVRGNNGHTIVLGYLSDTPTVAANRDEIFGNIALAAKVTVPIPYIWIILAFVLIAGSIVFAKRKVIFS